jgi:hypothetical protein
LILKITVKQGKDISMRKYSILLIGLIYSMQLQADDGYSDLDIIDGEVISVVRDNELSSNSYNDDSIIENGDSIIENDDSIIVSDDNSYSDDGAVIEGDTITINRADNGSIAVDDLISNSIESYDSDNISIERSEELVIKHTDPIPINNQTSDDLVNVSPKIVDSPATNINQTPIVSQPIEVPHPPSKQKIVIKKSKTPISRPHIVYKQPVVKRRPIATNRPKPVQVNTSCNSSIGGWGSINRISFGGEYAKSVENGIKTAYGARISAERLYNSVIKGLSFGPNIEAYAGQRVKTNSDDTYNYYGFEVTPKLQLNLNRDFATYIKLGAHITNNSDYKDSYKGLAYGYGMTYKLSGLNTDIGFSYSGNKGDVSIDSDTLDDHYTISIGTRF